MEEHTKKTNIFTSSHNFHSKHILFHSFSASKWLNFMVNLCGEFLKFNNEKQPCLFHIFCGCCFPLKSWIILTSRKSSITYWFSVHHLLNIPGMLKNGEKSKEDGEICEQTFQFVKLLLNFFIRMFFFPVLMKELLFCDPPL